MKILRKRSSPWVKWAAVAGLSTGVHAADVLSVAHPDEDFATDRTVVWTPLFQAAWDRMNSDLGGVPVKVEPPNALMARLDAFKWQAGSVMPEGKWKVWSGAATPDFVAMANGEAARMTGDAQGPFSAAPEHPDARPGRRLVLALLDRELKFLKPLHRSTSMPLAFRGGEEREQPVKFFGVRGNLSGGFGGMVKILSRDADSHALEIRSDEKESLVLYLPKERESFGAACTKLQGWRKERLKGEHGSATDPSLHDKDDLRIPYLDLEARADFLPALDGLRFHPGTSVPYTIVKAEQRTKFKITEKGAKVRAKVELSADPFGEAPPPPPMTPRDFHFDRPFFVFMWREGAELPYFGTWIGDASGMEAWE
ncbi:hypothetical protein OJ996_02505 [Luteolibacter sp. GHJ8]|uniref:Serpin domain-containing protein n=1 Tax=Luteolibacter rhizosphaerae TaxID=2989719 RepID=A0ABT3FXW5_9BACT|nr:hypothetical protein [Luteolibacter rhizosphaerae]MCW1912426.1 hypothetical protein [Luteolibacter rhizosphaerae]